jgi:hypothetical protein
MDMIRHYDVADQFEFAILSCLSQRADEQATRNLASKDRDSVEADRCRIVEDVRIM